MFRSSRRVFCCCFICWYVVCIVWGTFFMGVIMGVTVFKICVLMFKRRQYWVLLSFYGGKNAELRFIMVLTRNILASTINTAVKSIFNFFQVGMGILDGVSIAHD